jgi:Protein of unknown function with HXXEE motif
MNRASLSSSYAKFSTNSVNHRGLAWVSLCLALAVHVFDEAMTDFLSVYNPIVQAIRQKFSFFPMPVFTFDVWLTGLIAAIIILLLLSPFAFRQKLWMKRVSYPFAVLMLLNGLGHVAGSFYLGRLAPGVYSAPLLLAGSIYLLWSVRRG